jgi:hypothetical protein
MECELGYHSRRRNNDSWRPQCPLHKIEYTRRYIEERSSFLGRTNRRLQLDSG